MSADTITFTIEFSTSQATFRQIAEVAVAAQDADATVHCTPNAMGKAFIRELNSRYGTAVNVTEKPSMKEGSEHGMGLIRKMAEGKLPKTAVDGLAYGRKEAQAALMSLAAACLRNAEIASKEQDPAWVEGLIRSADAAVTMHARLNEMDF